MPVRRYVAPQLRYHNGPDVDFNLGVDSYYDSWFWDDADDNQNIAAYVDVWEWSDALAGAQSESTVDTWQWSDAQSASFDTDESAVDVWSWSDSQSSFQAHAASDTWEWGDAIGELWSETLADVWTWSDSQTGSYSVSDVVSDIWTWSDNGDEIAGDKDEYGTFDGKCYSMNEFGAVSEYSGWEFDSFASVSGAHYAVTPAGLYTIGGDTQAGADIDCGVRSGLTNFGAGALVGLDDLIVMADSDDETVAKIREMKNGHLNEHWYRSNVNVHGGPREYRIKSGRGLRGALLSIEVGNKNGAEWEMDQVQVYPVVLDRRRVS